MNKLKIVYATVIIFPLLLITINGIHIFLSSANTQPSNINTKYATITTNDIVNMTKPGQKVMLRGLVSSEDFNRVTLKPGDNPHRASILPNRPDGTVYTGIVTFSASKPVVGGISHRLRIDNSTFSNVDTKKFGNLYSGFHHDDGEKGHQVN